MTLKLHLSIFSDGNLPSKWWSSSEVKSLGGLRSYFRELHAINPSQCAEEAKTSFNVNINTLRRLEANVPHLTCGQSFGFTIVSGRKLIEGDELWERSSMPSAGLSHELAFGRPNPAEGVLRPSRPLRGVSLETPHPRINERITSVSASLRGNRYGSWGLRP
ncbi:MAG: hypothetical protein ACTS46_01015 [Candidatus Hodgkinia cicadicola]